MKKTILITIILLFSFNTYSQIVKKKWMLGGDLAFSYSESKSESSVDSKSFNVNISPNIGYFIWDKFALGTKLNYSGNRYKSNSGNSTFDRLLISPFMRYYFLNVEKPINIFLESSYRFAILNENNSTEFSLKSGASIFLNKNTALEVSLEYLNSNSKDIYVGDNTILLGFGLQIFL